MTELCDMGHDGFISPYEGSCVKDFFFALKNSTVSARFVPANSGTKGQHATSRPSKPLKGPRVVGNLCVPPKKRGPYGNRRPLPQSYLAYSSLSPVKDPSFQVLIMEVPSRCPILTALLHSSFKVPGVQAPFPGSLNKRLSTKNLPTFISRL
jgi:hypothetical protein